MKSLRRSHTSTSSANSSSTSLPSSSSSTTSTSPPSSSSSWIHLRSVLFVANPSSPSSVTSSDRSSRRKSPWSRRKRKRPLTPHQWRSLFTTEGKLRDGGVRFLKKVRSRVSLFERASNYVFDSHFSLYGYDMLLVGC